MTEQDSEQKGNAENKKSGGIYKIALPVDKGLCREAIRLASDKTKPVEEIATVAAQDPAIVLEFIKVANQFQVGGDKARIVSTKAAIMRLGNQESVKLLNKLIERQDPETPEERFELKKIRYRAIRIAIMSQVIAESVSRSFSDECYTAGLMAPIGQMVALLHLKERYLAASLNNTNSATLLSLVRDHRFDCAKYGDNYLRRNGLLESIINIISEDSLSSVKDRIILPMIIKASTELVEAFDLNRWERYAPGKQLQPKSAFRALSFQPQQYSKIYERASELFFSMKKRWSLESMDGDSATPIENFSTMSASEAVSGATPSGAATTAPHAKQQPSTNAAIGADEKLSLQDEISGLLQKFNSEEAASEDGGASNDSQEISEIPSSGGIVLSKPLLNDRPKKEAFARTKSAVASAHKTLSSVKSSEEAISSILEMLIGQGMFRRTALMVVSPQKDKATVVVARGDDLSTGQTLIIEDPVSPLAQAFTRVQSFGHKESELSPFGSKSFALAPISVNYPNPVVLYADAGNDPISFEGRRIFREVIGILCEKLPQLPGGLPQN